MKLVKTINPILIDPMLKVEKEVYFEMGDKTEPSKTDLNLVEFDIHLKVLETVYRQESKMVQVGNNPPEPVIFTMAYPYWVDYRSVKAAYKRSTFKAVLDSIEPEDYCEAFVQQVDMITNKWLTNSWTGQEVQQPRYFDLTASDLVVLTDEEVAQLTTPYEVQ